MADIAKTTNPFDTLDDLLAPLDAINSPAELQGMLCGRLCGDPLNEADWLRTVEDFMALPEAPDAELTDALIKLLGDTRGQLEGEGYSFVLLLPDDEQSMAERVAALSQWCHGFLSGFGASGAATSEQLPAEVADTLEDFSAIVQIEADDNDAASAEADFLEVAEYVRVAALGLFATYGSPAASTAPAPNLH